MTLINHRVLLFVCLLCPLFTICFGRERAASGHDVSAQTKSTVKQRKPAKKTQKPKQKPPTELDKLRDEYIKTTKELKASLEKLLALYEASESKAEARYAQSQKLFKDGIDFKKTNSKITSGQSRWRKTSEWRQSSKSLRPTHRSRRR